MSAGAGAPNLVPAEQITVPRPSSRQPLPIREKGRTAASEGAGNPESGNGSRRNAARKRQGTTRPHSAPGFVPHATGRERQALGSATFRSAEGTSAWNQRADRGVRRDH